MNNRLKKLNDIMKEKGISSLLVTKPENRRYLTGFTGTSGYLLITPQKNIFLTDFRYVEQANEEIYEGIEVVKHEFPMTKTLNEILGDLNVSTLYFEKNYITYETYEEYQQKLSNTTLQPSVDLVSEIRKIKDEDEIDTLKEAIKISDEAFLHIVNFIEEGVTERELSLEMEHFMKEKGAEKVSFDIIVASGERSALPHGVASEKKIKNGDFVKMDLGACYKGYCSDITRTVVLGEATEEQRKIYEMVLQAQMNAIRSIKAGMTGKEADETARCIIHKEGYGDKFGHGLGHGVGLEVHESPRLSPNHEETLKPGMTVTVEPGVYLPGWGGVRIEDIIVVKENGCEVLTQATKDLLEI
ncbi:M24 family metallopeptidase [Natranaerobius trueperi]|uniref:Xaa-Pro dipeptidase n=1 Tax=Natranaerobius trueperi TaxID=759412 RepID=A0A226C0B7_9FIRM|nr:Xaa-Pro peptidase family protein [Natranaerobius trueperi]OWZ84034.1 Xaa-Pro dipeptidase [Natranaerobius trueperi]